MRSGESFQMQQNAGHHGGIPNRTELKEAILGPSGATVCDAVWETAVKENPQLAELRQNLTPEERAIDVDFRSRFILSLLVDADWSDTANFHRQIAALPPEPAMQGLTAGELESFVQSVLEFIQSKATSCQHDLIRQAVRQLVPQHGRL